LWAGFRRLVEKNWPPIHSSEQSPQTILLNIGTAHNKIVLQLRERMTAEVAAILRETMIQAGNAFLSKVRVEVEVTIGDTWAEK
jgi:DNA polymerase I-like protein with 3'-5' exonuclease and polymerase domains